MSERVPIKVQVIKAIYRAVIPVFYKLQYLLEDLTAGILKLSNFEKALLLDAFSCSITLKYLFEDYLQEAEDEGVQELYLPSEEFNSVLQMSKVVESTSRTKFGPVAVWSN